MKVLEVEDLYDEIRILVNNEPVENVKEFTCLGADFTSNYNGSKEIKRRIGIAKSANIALTNTWRDRSISPSNQEKTAQYLGAFDSSILV